MKAADIIKLGLTLMLVGIISASVLSVTHGITDPIIQEQRMKEIEDTMLKYCPEADEVEIEEENGKECYFAIENGEKVKVATIVTGSGYGGDIEILLVMDKNEEIIGMSIIYHEETPGIGDVIEDEEFTEQFIGLDPDVPVSEEVDMITGATSSVEGAIEGVEKGREYLSDKVDKLEE